MDWFWLVEWRERRGRKGLAPRFVNHRAAAAIEYKSEEFCSLLGSWLLLCYLFLIMYSQMILWSTLSICLMLYQTGQWIWARVDWKWRIWKWRTKSAGYKIAKPDNTEHSSSYNSHSCFKVIINCFCVFVFNIYTLYTFCSCVKMQNYIVSAYTYLSYSIDKKLLMLCIIFIDAVLK